MIKLRTIIADDEPLLRLELKQKLLNHPNIEVVADCENGLQAAEAANRLQPDLIFLDIVMPGLDGFEVVQALQAEAMPIVVFATAYDQFAIKAFEVRAIDYLVKPYTDERLQQSIETALQSYNDRRPSTAKQDLIELASDLQDKTISEMETNQTGWPDELIIESREPQTKVIVEDIGWIDAAGDYMCIHANGETHIMRCTMKKLTQLLNPDYFRRIHRSTIVNINFVEEISPFQKGDYFVLLAGGTRLRLSRSYKDALPELAAATDYPL